MKFIEPHAASAFDVMVGIQRVLEGTDWPVCSAVYCVGMPGSLNTVVQFLGRAMRPKGRRLSRPTPRPVPIWSSSSAVLVSRRLSGSMMQTGKK